MHEVARPLFKLSKLSSNEKGEKKNYGYIKFKVARLQIMLVAKQYISTCRNCSSVGCLKCMQFHNWFWLH